MSESVIDGGVYMVKRFGRAWCRAAELIGDEGHVVLNGWRVLIVEKTGFDSRIGHEGGADAVLCNRKWTFCHHGGESRSRCWFACLEIGLQ